MSPAGVARASATVTPLQVPPFGDRRRRRIGLLGGSFNPPHSGHLHITAEALRRLGLDQVWWLVSPQNPLKAQAGMAPFSRRLAAAQNLIAAAGAGARVTATGVEQKLGTTYTARVLTALRRRYPRMTFVWLMGADNLAQLPHWQRWTTIFRTARVAVFDRSPYSYKALAGAAATRFRRARCAPRALCNRGLPAWSFLALRRHPASATALRLASRGLAGKSANKGR